MNFVSKNFNKAQSLVTKLEFVTKDLKAEFQYPALFEPQTFHYPKHSEPFRSKKKPNVELSQPSPLSSQNQTTVAVELPPSPIKLSRRQWSSNHRRWSSIKSQSSPIKLNGDASARHCNESSRLCDDLANHRQLSSPLRWFSSPIVGNASSFSSRRFRGRFSSRCFRQRLSFFGLSL